MRIVDPSATPLWEDLPGSVTIPPTIGASILRRIEAAGRTAYLSEGKAGPGTAAPFVASLIKRGHESVLEHVSVSVRIVCSRGVSHELVRHRVGVGYTQESTRYCNYSKDEFRQEIAVVRPWWWNKEGAWPTQRSLWTAAMKEAEKSYFLMLQFGASPQAARDVLPQATKTEIYTTMNLRAWRHFFELRTAKAAHPDMRAIARPLLVEFRRVVPVVFDDVGVAE